MELGTVAVPDASGCCQPRAVQCSRHWRAARQNRCRRFDCFVSLSSLFWCFWGVLMCMSKHVKPWITFLLSKTNCFSEICCLPLPLPAMLVWPRWNDPWHPVTFMVELTTSNDGRCMARLRKCSVETSSWWLDWVKHRWQHRWCYYVCIIMYNLYIYVCVYVHIIYHIIYLTHMITSVCIYICIILYICVCLCRICSFFF